MKIDPKDYHLPAKTKLAQFAENTISIIIDRKSRIIMSDGTKLLKKVRSIKEVDPSQKVNIVTTAPVCSKTRIFIEKSGVELQEICDLSALSVD